MSQNESQHEVVAVRRNSEGSIVEFKLASGEVVDYITAQGMVANGEIKHLQLFKGRDHEQHIRSVPDDIIENNLDQLPTF
jgi:6,7-dimethyl-8-ribityllumazine synthase